MLPRRGCSAAEQRDALTFVSGIQDQLDSCCGVLKNMLSTPSWQALKVWLEHGTQQEASARLSADVQAMFDNLIRPTSTKSDRNLFEHSLRNALGVLGTEDAPKLVGVALKKIQRDVRAHEGCP